MKTSLLIVLIGWTAVASLTAGERELQEVVLGAGCFWCVEAVYEQQPGVKEAISGFAGGHVENPTYEQVVAGGTGHAEVVLVRYDPEKTSLEALIDLFWKTHDPTEGRGVWPDFGSMYRPILLYADLEQKEVMQKSRAREQENHSKPIAVSIVPLESFTPAEEKHQNFARNNPNHRYIRNIVVPKLEKLGLETP